MVFAGQQKKDQFLLGKSVCLLNRKGGGRRLLNWIDGLLFEGRRKEGPIVCIILLASRQLIYCWKKQQIVSSGLFFTHIRFLYRVWMGWAALGEEEKSSSNKRSTCSVTTWSSVISAGSVLFFIFKSLCAFTAAHFFGCCCFFSKLLETRSLKINGGCLWLKHPLRFPCKDKLRINKSPGYLSFSRSTLVRKEGTICC